MSAEQGGADDATVARVMEVLRSGGMREVSSNRIGATTVTVDFTVPATKPHMEERFIGSSLHLGEGGTPSSAALRLPVTTGHPAHHVRKYVNEAIGATPTPGIWLEQVVPADDAGQNPHILTREGEELPDDAVVFARQMVTMANTYIEAVEPPHMGSEWS